jgi:hypothetical protein
VSVSRNYTFRRYFEISRVGQRRQSWIISRAGMCEDTGTGAILLLLEACVKVKQILVKQKDEAGGVVAWSYIVELRIKN